MVEVNYMALWTIVVVLLMLFVMLSAAVAVALWYLLHRRADRAEIRSHPPREAGRFFEEPSTGVYDPRARM